MKAARSKTRKDRKTSANTRRIQPPVESLSTSTIHDTTKYKSAKKTSRKSGATYDALFETMAQGVVYQNAEGYIFSANPAAEMILGLTLDQMQGRTSMDPRWKSIHEDGSDFPGDTHPAMVALRTGKEVRNVIMGVFHPIKNEHVWININAIPQFKAGANKPYQVYTTFDNITERKNIEYALRERLKELRCLYNIGLELQQHLETDDICQHVTEDIAAGMQFPDITAVLIELDDKQCASKKYAKELSHGIHAELKVGKEVIGHLRVYYTEQKPFIIPEEQNLINSIAQSLGLWLEHKQSQETLKESEEKFRSLVESTSDWIWEINSNGVYTYASPKVKDILGYEPEEVIGKTPFDLMPPEEVERIAHDFGDIIASGKPIKVLENICRHKNGHLVTLETSGVPIFDYKGMLRGYRGVDRDITERKRMVDSFIIADRLAALGNMAGGLAHELNNPLTGVIGYSQLLLDRKDLPEDIRKDITGIYEEAHRASRIVKEFMGFTLRPLQPKQPVDVNELINDVLKLRKSTQKKNDITVKTNFDPDIPLVIAGPVRMRQVFMDIITNAEYFMFEAHRKGTLTITTEKAGDFVRATFSDDGPGIPSENLTQIFNPFFTTKEIGKGIGLGLSICHSIVTEHGGRIYVESESDKGATFIAELPISPKLKPMA